MDGDVKAMSARVWEIIKIPLGLAGGRRGACTRSL